MGTHTSNNEPNYLRIAQVQLPVANASKDSFDEDRGGMSANYTKVLPDNLSLPVEYGGYGCGESKISIVQKINHDCEINRSHRERNSTPHSVS